MSLQESGERTDVSKGILSQLRGRVPVSDDDLIILLEENPLQLKVRGGIELIPPDQAVRCFLRMIDGRDIADAVRVLIGYMRGSPFSVSLREWQIAVLKVMPRHFVEAMPGILDAQLQKARRDEAEEDRKYCRAVAYARESGIACTGLGGPAGWVGPSLHIGSSQLEVLWEALQQVLGEE